MQFQETDEIREFLAPWIAEPGDVWRPRPGAKHVNEPSRTKWRWACDGDGKRMILIGIRAPLASSQDCYWSFHFCVPSKVLCEFTLGQDGTIVAKAFSTRERARKNGGRLMDREIRFRRGELAKNLVDSDALYQSDPHFDSEWSREKVKLWNQQKWLRWIETLVMEQVCAIKLLNKNAKEDCLAAVERLNFLMELVQRVDSDAASFAVEAFSEPGVFLWQRKVKAKATAIVLFMKTYIWKPYIEKCEPGHPLHGFDLNAKCAIDRMKTGIVTLQQNVFCDESAESRGVDAIKNMLRTPSMMLMPFEQIQEDVREHVLAGVEGELEKAEDFAGKISNLSALQYNTLFSAARSTINELLDSSDELSLVICKLASLEKLSEADFEV